MTDHLKLRVLVREPWDFCRQTGLEELTGWTVDHHDPDAVEWEMMLDHSYKLNDIVHGRVLLGPRYVGERLGAVFDAILGLPVRIAHRRDGDWHYAMVGTLTLLREEEEEK